MLINIKKNCSASMIVRVVLPESLFSIKMQTCLSRCGQTLLSHPRWLERLQRPEYWDDIMIFVCDGACGTINPWSNAIFISYTSEGTTCRRDNRLIENDVTPLRPWQIMPNQMCSKCSAFTSNDDLHFKGTSGEEHQSQYCIKRSCGRIAWHFVRGLCLTFPTGLRMLWENWFTLFTALYTFCRSASHGLREVWITSLGPRSSEPWFDRQIPNVLKSRRCAQWAAFYVRNAT